MPLKMSGSSNMACPALRCDHCGKRILGAGMAAVLYHFPKEGEETDVLIVHKGQCHRAKEGEYSSWDELSTFLQELTHNLSLPEELRPTVKEQSS